MASFQEPSQAQSSYASSVPSGSAAQAAQQHPHGQKLHELQIFLNSAPSIIHNEMRKLPQDKVNEPQMTRFALPAGDFVSCVLWEGIFHITGTDIVRSLLFRFEVTGRPVRNLKKFEEGVFSDLRNLKPGTASVMEDAKSAFLDLLFRHQCIRTQKKQKVFYWFEVDHDRLYLDALDRDLKREKLGMEPTTGQVTTSGMPFDYDPRQSLSEQFIGPGSIDNSGDGSLERTLRHLGVAQQYGHAPPGSGNSTAPGLPGPSNQTSRVEHDFPIPRPVKRSSDGIASSPDDSAEDGRQLQYPESGPFKRRRGNEDQETERPSSSAARYTPVAGPSLTYPSSSTAPDNRQPLQQMGPQSSSYGVVVPRAREDGGASDPHWATRAAQEEPRLTCPVPICRQVFVGKEMMVKHMRCHNAQDWAAKTRPSGISTTHVVASYPAPKRSASAEVLSIATNPPVSNFDFAMPLQHARNPDQISRMPPNNLYLTAPNHEPRILSANSSPSAGTFPQTPQQHLSPAQTTLSIESAPTSLVDDSIAYGYTAHPLQGRMPVPHSPRSSATVDDPYNLYLRRQVAPTAPSVASAPPTRQTFDLPPQPLRRWSPVGNGVAKEVALRRFRSATPTVGGAQMVMKSTVDHPAQMRSTSSPSHLGLLFPGHGEALPTQYPPPPPAYTPSGISLQAPQALNFHYNSASPISRPPSGSHPAMNGSQPPMPSTSPYQAFEGGNGPEAFAASFYGGQQVAESMSGPPHPAMLPATARPPVTPIATGYPVLMPAQQPIPSPSTYGHPSGPSYPVYPPYSS